MLSFIHSFQSEWLKKRRSASSWLTIAGASLIPLIILIARLTDFPSLSAGNSSPHAWEYLYNRSWQFMALFLLPMGVILATSLITQLEFKNNTWKQLHTTPQRLTTIFLAKLVVILMMMLQFFLLFNIGIYLTGAIPALFRGIPFPKEPYPFLLFVKGNSKFFIDCLPIIGLQYLISLQSKNALIPIGVGLALYTGSMISLAWKYGYTVPYSYCAANFTQGNIRIDRSVNILAWAVAYFCLFIIVGYILYLTKKEKG